MGLAKLAKHEVGFMQEGLPCRRKVRPITNEDVAKEAEKIEG
jgi:hypothetical protein